MSYLEERASKQPEAVKAPATNLTLGSGFVALIGSVVVLFNDSFKAIFGDDVSKSLKASVLIAVIAAWAVIAASDLFARAIAKAATERADAEKEKAKARKSAATKVVALPQAVAATKTKGPDKPGFKAVALKIDAEEKCSILMVKSGEASEWVSEEDVDFQ